MSSRKASADADEVAHRLSLEELRRSINKDYGEGTLIPGQDLQDLVIKRLSSGSLSLDWMLGGGWVMNQFNEIIGDESSGKTALIMKTLAFAQAQDPKFFCLWVASETFNAVWAAELGVDLRRVELVESNVTEVAFGTCLKFLENRACDMIVIDSLPALVPAEEDEAAIDKMQMGLQARLTGKFLRKAKAAGNRSLVDDDRPCTCLVVNQWRERIGIMFGDPRTPTGGRHLRYHLFTRVEVKRDEWVLDGAKNKVGLTIKAHNIKNKSAPPQRLAVVDFYFTPHLSFGAGDFDVAKEVFNMATMYGLMVRRGSLYEWSGHQWRTKEGTMGALREDLYVQRDLNNAIRKEAGLPELPNLRQRAKVVRRGA